MFLFLSKLLPSFIYPLGLSLWLMVVVGIVARRQKLRLRYLVLVSVLVLWLASNGGIANSLVQSLEWRYLPPPDLPDADAIVLLGGSTRSAIYPRPMPDLTEQGDRVIYAAKLYREGKAPIVIASGGRIPWLSDDPPESADMASLLEFMGVPSTAIVQDPRSLNTRENAVNVGQILDDRGWKRILLVTSAMHMPRSQAIFQKLNIDSIPAPTDFTVSQSDRQRHRFNLGAGLIQVLPDAHHLYRTTQAIKEYIGLGIYGLKGWI